MLLKIISTVRGWVTMWNQETAKLLEGPQTKKSRLDNLVDNIGTKYMVLSRNRILYDIKRTQAQLRAYYRVEEGTLIQSKVELEARTDISLSEYQTDWTKIPAGSMLLFLGVEHDYNFDAVTLKVLWESRIYYIHKNANFVDFTDKFQDKFKVFS